MEQGPPSKFASGPAPRAGNLGNGNPAPRSGFCKRPPGAPEKPAKRKRASRRPRDPFPAGRRPAAAYRPGRMDGNVCRAPQLSGAVFVSGPIGGSCPAVKSRPPRSSRRCAEDVKESITCMPMRDKIERAIQMQPCTVKDLKAKFGGDRAADRKVMEALDELVRDAVVCQTQGGLFHGCGRAARTRPCSAPWSSWARTSASPCWRTAPAIFSSPAG